MDRGASGLLFAIFATVATAQTQVSQSVGPAKTAWVNPDQLIMNCDEGKRDLGELQRFVEQKNQEVEASSKEVTALMQKLDVQGSKLTDEARMDLEDQYATKSTKLQRFQQDTQSQIEKRRTRIANRIVQRAQPVIEKFARGNGLNCVLYLNQEVAWADPGTVITDEIVKAYNAAYPAPAAPKK